MLLIFFLASFLFVLVLYWVFFKRKFLSFPLTCFSFVMLNFHNSYYANFFLFMFVSFNQSILVMKRIPKKAISFRRNPCNGVLMGYSCEQWYKNPVYTFWFHDIKHL